MASARRINELLECSVCLDRFTRPKVLPCQHTYCYECLISLAAGGRTIKCPQCRKKYQIPAEGVEGFPGNLIVNNLLSLEEDDNDTESGAASSGSGAASSGSGAASSEPDSRGRVSAALSSLSGSATGSREAVSLGTSRADNAPPHLRVGDRVRVKRSVQIPYCGWGHLTHESVGIVKSISGEEMKINFPEHWGWSGIMSEMELAPNINIKVGDRVRRKQIVTGPRSAGFDWGDVTYASVGIVRSIMDHELVIDFPQRKNCIGVLSEIELVPNVGDRVRVKRTIGRPRNDWGKVARGSIGIVRSVEGEKMTVDFPEQKDWRGILNEMELVPEVCIKVGDKVRVKQTIEKPRNNWGKVARRSVGIVKSIEGEKLKIDFSEQQSWNGICSEMELVPDDDEACIKVGDRVRVKPTVEMPRKNWGKVTHHSVGIVKFIAGEMMTIDFPEQKDWSGVLSEMELSSADDVDGHPSRCVQS